MKFLYIFFYNYIFFNSIEIKYLFILNIYKFWLICLLNKKKLSNKSKTLFKKEISNKIKKFI